MDLVVVGESDAPVEHVFEETPLRVVPLLLQGGKPVLPSPLELVVVEDQHEPAQEPVPADAVHHLQSLEQHLRGLREDGRELPGLERVDLQHDGGVEGEGVWGLGESHHVREKDLSDQVVHGQRALPLSQPHQCGGAPLPVLVVGLQDPRDGLLHQESLDRVRVGQVRPLEHVRAVEQVEASSRQLVIHVNAVLGDIQRVDLVLERVAQHSAQSHVYLGQVVLLPAHLPHGLHLQPQLRELVAGGVLVRVGVVPDQEGREEAGLALRDDVLLDYGEDLLQTFRFVLVYLSGGPGESREDCPNVPVRAALGDVLLVGDGDEDVVDVEEGGRGEDVAVHELAHEAQDLSGRVEARSRQALLQLLLQGVDEVLHEIVVLMIEHTDQRSEGGRPLGEDERAVDQPLLDEVVHPLLDIPDQLAIQNLSEIATFLNH